MEKENTKNSFKSFPFIINILNDDYINIPTNAKLLYCYLLHIHKLTPVSEDGIRYIDITLNDIQEIFNIKKPSAYKLKNYLIKADLIGEVKQFYSEKRQNTRNKIVALYIKKIIE